MTPLREFTDARELVRFYRDLIARRKALGRPPPPAPVLVEIVEPAPAPPPPPEPEPVAAPLPAPPPMPPLARSTSIKRIILAAAQEFDMPPESVCGPSRAKRDIVVRHVAVLLARELTKLSNCAIGRALNRDHTTILHAVKSMRRRVAADPVLALKVARVRRMLLEPSTNHGEDK